MGGVVMSSGRVPVYCTVVKLLCVAEARVE